MNGYVPLDTGMLLLTLALLGVELAAGYAVTAIRRSDVGRCCAWGLAIAATMLINWLTADAPAGFRMLAIVGGLLYGMKAVVCVEAQAGGCPRLTPRQWLAFTLLWFGMRPAVFAETSATRRDGAGELLRRGWRRVALGAAFLAAAWLVASPPARSGFGSREVANTPVLGLSHREALATALLLPGLSLVLHFGVFNLLAGAWRWAGLDCRALFRAPFLSKSLAEFWARRWNLGFTEMTSLAIFRPLRRRLGDRGATFAAFVASGLFHELAISVPVRAGFGLPTLYFALHGAAMLIERRLDRTGRSLAQRPWLGRLWTLTWILLPLPLLFHPPFLRGCFWPLVGV